MKKFFKVNTAITLIALVITIIILLILAGITISALTNSGLFENAKTATKKYSNAQKNEENQITKYTNEINNYINNSREDIRPSLLWTNENPNSNFSAQTIPLDLSEYKYVIVILKPWIEENYYPRTPALLPVSDENWNNEIRFGATSTSRIRTLKAKTSGVTISDELIQGNNNEILPLYIYGIKSDLGIWSEITGE